MILLEEVMTDFSRGVQDSAAATAFDRREAQRIMNGRLAPEGTCEVRRGSQRTTAIEVNADVGYGAIYFQPDGATPQIVAFFGDEAHYSEDDGETWTLITTGLPAAYWSLAPLRAGGVDYLYAANGGTTFRWDGSTWEAAPGVPANVKYLAVFNRRLYVAGHNGPQVQASEIDDPTNFVTPDGLSVQVQTHEGDNIITGLYQIGPHLLVFFRDSTAYIDGFGESDLITAAGPVGVSRSTGCVAFRTVKPVSDQAVMWLSERGLEYYQPGNAIQLRTTKLRAFFRDTINWNAISNIPGLSSAIWIPETHEYICAVPTGTALTTTTVVVHNTVLKANTLFRYNEQLDPGEITGTVFIMDSYLEQDDSQSFQFVQLDEQLYLDVLPPGQDGQDVGVDSDGYLSIETVATVTGATLFTADRAGRPKQPESIGYDGFMRHLEIGGEDDVDSGGTNGRPIDFELVSRPLLFNRPFNRKRARQLRVSAVAQSAAAVDVNVRADGLLKNTHTLNVPATTGNQPRQPLKARVSGKGRTLQVEIRTADQVAFAGLSLRAEMLREP